MTGVTHSVLLAGWPLAVLVGSLLVATVEAGLCGVVVGTLAVLRPRWLATFSERLCRLP